MGKKLSFEHAMERMEQIVNLLEEGELTLEESLKTFEEGITLYRCLIRQLEEIEGKVKVIMEEPDGGVEEVYIEPEGDRDLGF